MVDALPVGEDDLDHRVGGGWLGRLGEHGKREPWQQRQRGGPTQRSTSMSQRQFREQGHAALLSAGHGAGTLASASPGCPAAARRGARVVPLCGRANVRVYTTTNDTPAA